MTRLSSPAVRAEMFFLLAAWGIALMLAGCSARAAAEPQTAASAPIPEGATEFWSPIMQRRIVVPKNVFPPKEAENYVLPYMRDHARDFRGKQVLEIGTGSGIISLYAGLLGARKIVATDISSDAIESVRLNKKALSLERIIEERRVPLSDISAYSVIKPGETFDIIISNPPYSVDLDQKMNTPLSDIGILGPTLLQGLAKHLTPGGKAVLLYASIFYQTFMAKYAQHLGLKVEYDVANNITPWELETLSNAYLARLAHLVNVPMKDLRVEWNKDWKDLYFPVRHTDPQPTKPLYPGLMYIQRAR